MKNFIVSLSIAVTLFTYGCENAVSKNMTAAEAKKQQVTDNLTKLVDKKQSIKNPAKESKATQAEIVNLLKLSELSLDQKPLDLTVPLRIPKINKISYRFKKDRKRYLPDLFDGQKDKKNNSIQLVGKFIKRHEVTLGKEKSADGAGIDFKLTH